jgi:hypothetical protein
MTWLAWLPLVLCLLAVSGMGLSAYGSKRWTDATWMLTRMLESARTYATARSAPVARFDSRELEGLPAPVQRYFRAALQQGHPIISALTIEIGGAFNMSATAEQWKRFTSRQRVETRER